MRRRLDGPDGLVHVESRYAYYTVCEQIAEDVKYPTSRLVVTKKYPTCLTCYGVEPLS